MAIRLGMAACGRSEAPVPAAHAAEASTPPGASAYFDNAGRDGVLTGGVKMIPISTARGTFNVWTKRIGNNPTARVLLLHSGPGATQVTSGGRLRTSSPQAEAAEHADAHA